MKILHQVSKDRLPERYQRYCDPERPMPAGIFYRSEGKGGCLGVFGAISLSVFCFLLGLFFLFVSVVETENFYIGCAIFWCLAYLFWRGFQNARRKAKIIRQGKWRQGVYVDSDGILGVDAKNRCSLVPRSYVLDNFPVEKRRIPGQRGFFETQVYYYTPHRQAIKLPGDYVEKLRAWSRTGKTFNL